MTVLSYNKAATRAGVSRQRITKLKRDHNDKKSVKTYFVFNPDGGKEGINIDDPSWKNYENKNNLKRVNKKKVEVKQNSKPNIDMNNYVHKTNILTATVKAIQETKKFTGDELKGLLNKIDRRYRELEG